MTRRAQVTALALVALAPAACDEALTPPEVIVQRPANPTCHPPVSASNPAARLSETGCVDPMDPRRLAPGLIPYDVNSPLWSDGAEKQRFVALPDGQRLGVDAADEGHFLFPVGSVLLKSFAVGGRRVETRLLVRFNELTWKGYSYAWNEAGTDADLVPDQEGGVKKDIADGAGGTQRWHFPSRAQCLQCHTVAAGVSLGPSTAQLERAFSVAAGLSGNQLDVWEQMGLFEQPLGQPRAAALEPPAGSAGLEQRARSYLHANCANCHRPQGTFEGIDLRRSTPFAETGLCNVEPEKGTLDVEGARRLVPGQPDKSLLSLRMHRLDKGRMPQIGTSVVDAAGVELVDAWIRSLTACP
jgi:uncharacterized repeat protein (TIGR03806 family)